MKKILLLLTLSFTALLSAPALALGQYTSGAVGVDVSWPNCSTAIANAAFGIVGVSGGTSYSTNTCLANETSNFSQNLSLYLNTGWNSKSALVNPDFPKLCAIGDNNCLAYNYGYNAAVYAENAAAAADVHSASWWLDVETSNTWNKSVSQNQSSLQGTYDALSSNISITTIGIYSTTTQWQTITGGWVNNWPSWGATTWTTANQARTYCLGHQFTGGPSYLMQYRPKKTSLDRDVAC